MQHSDSFATAAVAFAVEGTSTRPGEASSIAADATTLGCAVKDVLYFLVEESRQLPLPEKVVPHDPKRLRPVLHGLRRLLLLTLLIVTGKIAPPLPALDQPPVHVVLLAVR
ncbi:hypothetical protein Dsin_002537 [Dipteronia sinensis]|uniref:Uncharacterized protein n=1 Tax=Dipteronia sinensis TaxID=43782 RepID=A0AAE0B6D7_9ROSI|nr:hypothetical protein Dsin_002537 [Dipteronia sinensis]